MYQISYALETVRCLWSRGTREAQAPSASAPTSLILAHKVYVSRVAKIIPKCFFNAEYVKHKFMVASKTHWRLGF